MAKNKKKNIEIDEKVVVKKKKPVQFVLHHYLAMWRMRKKCWL